MDCELKKNGEYTVTVSDYTSEGYGVARIGGRAVFIPFTLKGQTVRIKILKVTSGAVYAKAVGAPDGAADGAACSGASAGEPACRYFKACGGCDTWHMTYGEELSFKLGKVNGALRRIGRQELEIKEIIGSDSPVRYRNKGIFNISRGRDGRAAYGFFRQRTHELVEIDSCLIQMEAGEKVAAAVCSFMNENGFAPYDEATGKGTVRHVFCRSAVSTEDAVACIITARGFGAKTAELTEHLLGACPWLTGIVLNVNRERFNTILAGRFFTLYGRAEIEDSICGHRFSISPQAFYQINPPQAERLYRRAVEYACEGRTENAFELYCGVGTISLCLAERFGSVTAAEIVPEAVENAERNAAANGIGNVRFICADAAQCAGMYARGGAAPDAVLVDPPRKGMQEDAIRHVCAIGPERIVYVSCDPATLARDVLLFSSLGYELKKGTAVDMFPRTRHVETVVLMSRVDR